MQGLAPIDGWALLAILAKAMGYCAMLLAIGGPVFLAIFRKAPIDVIGVARKITQWACVAGCVILALRFGIRAGRLSGAGVWGMIDPMLLRIVWESPLGAVAVLRAGGYLLTFVALAMRPLWLLGLGGAAMIALSATQIGHVSALQGLYPNLLILHLVMAGFWVAALVPLHAAVTARDGAALLQAFGWIAMAVVGLLLLAGLVLSFGLISGVLPAIGTAYGTVLLCKMLAVAALLAVAGRNKLRLVPALARAVPGAHHTLQAAIRWEIGLVLFILLMTATLTTVTTPPINT